jgi:hypothetical protein
MRRLGGATVAMLVLAMVTSLTTGAGAGVVPAEDSADARWFKLSLTINGTYTPIMGAFDCDQTYSGETAGIGDPGFVLYGHGSAPDFLDTDLVPNGSSLGSTRVPLTIPGSYTPIVGDFDGDACSDIVWYAPGPAADSIWWGGPTGLKRGKQLTINGTYIPLAGRVAGRTNSPEDVFFYDPDGKELIWRGTGDREQPFKMAPAPQISGSSYRPTIYRDNATSETQILWYGPGTIPDQRWSFDLATNTTVSEPVSISGSYVPQPCGYSTLLYGGASTSRLFSTTSGTDKTWTISVGSGYRVSGTNDARGCPLIWHRPGSAPDQVWLPKAP